MSDFHEQKQVRAIKFRVLKAEELEQEQRQQQQQQQQQQQEHESFASKNETLTGQQNKQQGHNLRRRQAREYRNGDNCELVGLEQNFTFDYSYPAVIFDSVCFSAERREHGGTLMHEVVGIVVNRVQRLISSKSKVDQRVAILKSVNLNVPYGSIFGLLGPSSCGKTTLLRCLVGLLKPESGNIQLLGCSAAGTANKCRIPGPDIGYMPQDLALYDDFSISRLLALFGAYMKMEPKLIQARIKFLCQFLDLPENERLIGTLSGGQKRRVSFAIACLHMPPLIILDEPTVGVDPMLRQSIWSYLRWLAKSQRRTIIITTHYIEEAAQADQVAFMRTGQILVQDTPANIMKSTGCNKLEDAFLKICLNKKSTSLSPALEQKHANQKPIANKLCPQLKFVWPEKVAGEMKSESIDIKNEIGDGQTKIEAVHQLSNDERMSKFVNQLKQEALAKLNVFDGLSKSKMATRIQNGSSSPYPFHPKNARSDRLSLEPTNSKNDVIGVDFSQLKTSGLIREETDLSKTHLSDPSEGKMIKSKSLRGTTKLTFDKSSYYGDNCTKSGGSNLLKSLKDNWGIVKAIFQKNVKRNLNSIPLIVFQFMLPIVQMVSFSLCVGGRPSNVGIGLVNHDKYSQISVLSTAQPFTGVSNSNHSAESEGDASFFNESLSDRYISFLDSSMLSIRPYSDLKTALDDVRRTKLWAAMEIGENFTEATQKRYDLDNINQLDPNIVRQSIIKVYPDLTNKVLNMVFFRSLGQSYQKFLADQFVQFEHLPLESKEPIFDITPNLISNSIDGYTESIAAGLMASLTYIMAAGLTTFIMVVERDSGMLERTYTCGIRPGVYLLVHAFFRSCVMMLQIAVVLFLTFYMIKQPLVGSIWLAYLMLMTLNCTGISFGLMISSLVRDQSGAALAIVSSLVFKITLSGILWPLEAVPNWIRALCYIQPMAMPVQSLKSITLKGGTIADRSVYLGFIVSLAWMTVFLTIAAKKFKFYQH